MSEICHFRPAVAEDVPLLLEFIRKLAHYEKKEDEVVATEALLEQHLFGSDPRAEAIFALLDGREVGFALYFHNFSTFLGKPGLYVEDVFVEESCRSRGVGKALFEKLFAIARARGCGRVNWWVLDWNTPAIEFYRGLGAVAQDEWTVYKLDLD